MLLVLFQEHSPNIPLHKLIYLLYPYNTFLTKDHVKNVQGVLHNLNVNTKPKWDISFGGIKYDKTNSAVVSLVVNGQKSEFRVPTGGGKTGVLEKKVVKTAYQSELLNELLLSHSVADFCIVGKCNSYQFIQANRRG